MPGGDTVRRLIPLSASIIVLHNGFETIRRADTKETMRYFDVLDRIAEKACADAREPAFSNEVNRRRSRSPAVPTTDQSLLLELAKIIAYSQNARADSVDQMIAARGLNSAFGDFDVARVAAMDPSTILERHWKKADDRIGQLSAMRFRRKVHGIVGVAQALLRMKKGGPGFRAHLGKFAKRIRHSRDVEVFWKNFADLRQQLRMVKMPFFGQLTSLLHLLLHSGFDCVKPDLAVMRVAKDNGLLPSEPRDEDLVKLVRLIQEYSVLRAVRPAVVDFYFLVEARQSWAKQFVK